MKKLVLYGLLTILLVVGGFASFFTYTLWRHGMFEEPVFETEAPDLPDLGTGKKVLVFSKTNGFRHVDAIPAANELFRDIAVREEWGIFFTENAASHNKDDLSKFDLVIWNNASGNNFLPEQREAFKEYIEGGGRLLAIHASGGDPSYDWKYHPEEIIRAQFQAHPMAPQFQEGHILVEDRTHASTKHLPERWVMEDEWYSFLKSPRDRVNVLATLDEGSYSPEDFVAGDLRMGEDHPMIWHHELGKGKVYYSAIGHLAARYYDEEYRTLLHQAAVWLIEN